MAPHMVIKMNETTYVVLALFLVLSVGYTSGSVLSSSVLSSSVFQENLTQDNVAQEQVQQECDKEGAATTKDCNVCYCLNGHLSCSKKICFNSGPLETDIESQQNSTKDNEDSDNQEDPDYEDPDNQEDADYEDPDYQEDPDYKECVEGTKWTEECNICECSFGQALCTMKTCLPECVDGSSWVDDCNTCECYYGETTCTNRKCLSDSATNCKEGSSWTQDCNTCFCSNGITSCSKEICTAEGDVTSTQPPETTTNNCNLTIVGCTVMDGPKMAQSLSNDIQIPSELDYCSKTINGQLTYSPYVPNCYDQGKLACAYCEKKQHKFNPRTCKCHRLSRFKGRK